MGLFSRIRLANFDFGFSWLPIFRSYVASEDQAGFEPRPCPSLVEVPVRLVAGSIKDRLPVREYGCKEEGSTNSTKCAICLKCMREGDEVRELCNCSHVFHCECLDGWIDQGQMTCPLCRSKLLSSDHQSRVGSKPAGGDPWRRERMIYLFGEDFVFGNAS